MYRKIITLMAILWSAAPVWAQFTIMGADTPVFNPEELIRDVCLGEGIEVLDVEFNGVPAAVGRFSGGQDYIGLDEGFLMTTGFASSLSGQGYGADGTAPFIANVPNGSTAGYPGLESLANNEEIRDVAMYTIRFVPAGDSIMFRYVFASEEYPLFVCSRFNDVFGFFLTKSVGDADPETVNIAKVPGTELPVSINSVNNGEPGTHFSVDVSYCEEPAGSLDNATFFNSNSGQNRQPVYDGFTDVFVAKAAVEPCQAYTMTLVLADIGDVLWDSGLFFEAKSFCSFTGGGHENEEVAAVVEGCGPSTLAIGLEAFPANDYPLTYSISGTAAAGEDYSLGLSASGEITEPSAEWLLELMVPDDGEAEEVETIEINISGQACSEKTYTIKLFDPLQIEGPASALCTVEPITLNVPGPEEALETFTFNWSTGQAGPVIEVNPGETTTYILEYGDALNTCTREFTVVLEARNPPWTWNCAPTRKE